MNVRNGNAPSLVEVEKKKVLGAMMGIDLQERDRAMRTNVQVRRQKSFFHMQVQNGFGNTN